MASLLRQIVAGPRAPHPEAGLDLCYVTDSIVVTSGPSSTYPQRAYRNPTDELVNFLDSKHGADWSIWEFRAEGTGYPDSEVYGRVHHFPWPDHHPPPFALIPNIMASMRNWLIEPGEHKGGRVVVVHCKAGKGRSGSIATSYLISQEGWSVADALERFTERRMRSGFGSGVSIPSQLRYIGYVDYWTHHGKQYLERSVEIVEVHAWGLREGVKVCVQGYVDEGKKIKTFHTFSSDERLIIDGKVPKDQPLATKLGFASAQGAPANVDGTRTSEKLAPAATASTPSLINSDSIPTQPDKSSRKGSEPGGRAVIFRPARKIVVPSSDICIDLERRNKAPYGWTLVTAVAHVWYNVYFEGRRKGDPEGATDLEAGTARGVFEIDWDAMDGIKGSSRKGVRALDRIAVVWRAIGDETDGQAKVVEVPEIGEPVPEAAPADWSGVTPVEHDDNPNKNLGMRVETPGSANVSKASSMKSNSSDQEERTSKTKDGKNDSDYEESIKGVKTHVDPKEDPAGIS